jgi:hypothetical protein
LVGEAQVRLDDPFADRLEIQHPRVAREVRLGPRAAIRPERGPGRGLDHPVIEGPVRAGPPDRVSQPAHRPVLHREVGAHVNAGEQTHPQVARPLMAGVGARIGEHPALETHAAQVHDRLAEHRIAARRDAVRSAFDTLRFGDPQLVVDPAVARLQRPRIRVVGRYRHVGGTGDGLEVLPSPGVAFDDRHGARAGVR